MTNNHSKVRQILAFMAVLVVGLGLGLLTPRLLGRGGAGPSPASPAVEPATAGVSDEGDPDALAALPEPGPLLPPDQATDPESAVTGFLTAEASGNFEASFAFLSAADKEHYPSPAAWIQHHANLPPVTSFRIEGSAPVGGSGGTPPSTGEGSGGTPPSTGEGSGGGSGGEGERVRVTTLTGYEPGLDEILGLTPARARTSWVTVQEQGVWRVLLGESSEDPLYPSTAPAPEVARQWAERRIACEQTDELEMVTLVGMPALGERLCNAKGELRLGTMTTLPDSTSTSALVSAYGPDVFSWARAVPVESPTPMQLVLAPIGADWRVVGIIREDVTR